MAQSRPYQIVTSARPPKPSTSGYTQAFPGKRPLIMPGHALHFDKLLNLDHELKQLFRQRQAIL